MLDHVRFSNRPFGVKRFQIIHHHSVDVARVLVLLFGIGTQALPSWDSKTRRNNFWGGRFFNKIKQCRRVATLYDKLAANYLAFIKLASIRIWPRANESTA